MACRQSTPRHVDGLHPSPGHHAEATVLSRIELLQGTLDFIVLQTLRWGPRHGYGIAQMIRASSNDVASASTPARSTLPCTASSERSGSAPSGTSPRTGSAFASTSSRPRDASSSRPSARAGSSSRRRSPASCSHPRRRLRHESFHGIDARRDQRDAELDEEIRGHFAMAVAERIARGESPDDATRRGAARVRQRRTREGNDARDVGRRVARAAAAGRALRVSLAAAVAGIHRGRGRSRSRWASASNTAMFTVVNAMLLRPLPFRDPGRLFIVSHVPARGMLGGEPGMFDRQYDVVSGDDARLRSDDELQRISGDADARRRTSAHQHRCRHRRVLLACSASLPAIGRAFTADEHVAGAEQNGHHQRRNLARPVLRRSAGDRPHFGPRRRAAHDRRRDAARLRFSIRRAAVVPNALRIRSGPHRAASGPRPPRRRHDDDGRAARARGLCSSRRARSARGVASNRRSTRSYRSSSASSAGSSSRC